MEKREKEKRKRARRIKKIRERINSPSYKLEVFWKRYKHNFSAKKLIRIAEEIDFPKIQEFVIKEFLSRNNLTFADFYRLLGLPKRILESNPDLEKKIWKQCFDICTADNLYELLNLGESRAGKELFRRIDNKLISMGKAKQILISLFERSYNEKIRNECWKRIEAIGLNEDELKYLLDLDKASNFYRYIEKILAKRTLKKEEKTIGKIKELVAQIKQRQE